MSRLTKAIKEQTVINAIRRSDISEKRADLKIKVARTAELCRMEAIGGPKVARALGPIVAQVNALCAPYADLLNSQDVFHKDDDIGVSVGGKQYRLRFCGNRHYNGDERVLRVVPNKRFDIAADSNLGELVTEVLNLSSDIDNEVKSLKASVQAVLDSVTTIAKLLKVWPEAKEILPDWSTPPETTALAVPLDELNKLCGLGG